MYNYCASVNTRNALAAQDAELLFVLRRQSNNEKVDTFQKKMKRHIGKTFCNSSVEGKKENYNFI